MSNPPKWAQDLTLKALLWWESQGNTAPLVELKWRHAKNRYQSSGVAYLDGKIVVSAGKNRTDQKLVLLHEIAHQLNPGEHHGDKFWDTAWALFRWAKLPVRYCVNREKSYRVGAYAAYKRSLK